MTLPAAVLALAALVSQQGWSRPDERLTAGPLTLDVYVSETAHVFHLVDQLSAWDDACHGQYRRHVELSPEDEAALARYAEVRARRRWGQGLEQTFYVPMGLDRAARAGERAGLVRADELGVILPVLERFAPRARALMEAKRSVLEHALDGIDRARLAEAAEKLGRFTGTRALTLPVFPLASPEPGGGGMDGGRLRWELHEDGVSFSVLLHECTHGFLMAFEDELAAVVARTPGLTRTVLGEGFAYGVAPGLYPDGSADDLALSFARDLGQDQPWKPGGYEWQRAFGLALRPHLAEAFREGQSLEEFLPRARDAFLATHELLERREDRGPPKLAIAGPAGGAVRQRLKGGRYHLWIHSWNHAAQKSPEVLRQLGPGDLFVILVSGDDPERVPAAYADLAPVEPDEVRRRLRAGGRVEEETVARAGFRVVLLAAPTVGALERLVAESALVHD